MAYTLSTKSEISFFFLYWRTLLLTFIYQKQLSFLQCHDIFPCVWLGITVISITQFQQLLQLHEDKLAFLSPLHTFVHSNWKYTGCERASAFVYWGGILVLGFFLFFSSTNVSLLSLTFFRLSVLYYAVFSVYHFLINSLLSLDKWCLKIFGFLFVFSLTLLLIWSYHFPSFYQHKTKFLRHFSSHCICIMAGSCYITHVLYFKYKTKVKKKKTKLLNIQYAWILTNCIQCGDQYPDKLSVSAYLFSKSCGYCSFDSMQEVSACIIWGSHVFPFREAFCCHTEFIKVQCLSECAVLLFIFHI